MNVVLQAFEIYFGRCQIRSDNTFRSFHMSQEARSGLKDLFDKICPEKADRSLPRMTE